MITNDKVIEIFCATDEFSKKFDNEIEKSLFSTQMGRLAAGVHKVEKMSYLKEREPKKREPRKRCTLPRLFRIIIDQNQTFFIFTS